MKRYVVKDLQPQVDVPIRYMYRDRDDDLWVASVPSGGGELLFGMVDRRLRNLKDPWNHVSAYTHTLDNLRRTWGPLEEVIR